MLRIEVVYAAPGCTARHAIEVEEGATVRDAIEQSGVLARCPEIDLARNRVGIHGKLASLATRLSDLDRVEILRPLQVDPQTARRGRASRRR